MTSREPSSSPDILGPPGDAAYLISSPMKPFAGRQSWLSPAVFKTPRKRPRASLSPSKASHSIQFDDIILPGSPTMNIDGRQRSISPSKLQSEGNLSPWRIRVTVQAEQEDQMNDGGSPRRRLLTPGAKTMKIPLKDDSGMYEPSPKRRRGRPRKSDIQNEFVTPIKGTPARAKGSPGYTPGPAATGSTGKRKRGRPRKSLPEQNVVDSVETDPFHTVPENSQTPPPEEPLGLAADGASDDGDGYDDIWNPSALGYSEEPNNADFGHSPTPPERRQYSSPDRQPTEPTHTTDIPTASSPAKEHSSPRRDHPGAVSQDHTQHAGHTPRPRRIYPTPTSSSVVEEEGPTTQKRSPQKRVPHEPPSENFPDPTDEHREFDTIIESEGFSMVSLDTLPSAKQLALNSSTNAPKGALKPFFGRQSGTGSEKKPRVSFDSHAAVLEVDSASSHQSQSAPERVPVKDLSPPTSSNNSNHENTTVEQTPATHRSTPKSPSAPVEASRPAGEQLAQRQEELERRLESENELRELDEAEEEEEGEEEVDMVTTETRPENSPKRTPNSLARNTFNAGETGSAILSQRQAEWQREREAVSREIQSANTNRIIVIEDDTDAQQPSDDNDGEAELEKDVSEDDYDIWQEEANLSHSHLSSRSHSRENASSQQRQSDSSPWKRGEDVDQENNVDIPPVPWERQQGNMPYLGKSRLGRLREEEVDLSVLLQKRNSPNTRKYYGYSSPQTGTSQHAPSSAARTPATSKSYQATSSPRIDLSSPVRPVAAESSPQAFGGPRSEQEAEQEHSPARSPSQSLGRSNSQWDEDNDTDGDHAMSHGRESEQVHHEEVEIPREHAEATHNSPSVHEPSALTPPPERQQSDAPAPGSWFRRLSHFTPGWWGSASPEREHASRADTEENDRRLEDEREEAKEEDEEEEEEEEEEEGDENWDDVHNQLPQSQDGPVRREVEYPSLPRSPDVQSAKTERTYKQSIQRKPLSVSGYFTNDHYQALYRLYRLAKRSPELFPYYPNEERTEIIGDWLWTADGDYGLPVTELQFAILDKFVDELAEADIRNGGSGEIGWSEEELHKRLFSIIVGEQIRKDRKARTQEAAAGMMQNGYTQTSSRSRYRS